MTRVKPHTLICTVGTSMFHPNLEGLSKKETLDPPYRELAQAYLRQDWSGVAAGLLQLDGAERICGAEINSIVDLVKRGYLAENLSLVFCHSMTDEGRQIAAILERYFRGTARVKSLEIEDLQDQDPKRFRTRGLRNLAKAISRVIREQGAEYCAINATGGYKAQIAVAVLLGQAVGVPVYYKHERFNEIIAFPPMPVALDFSLWLARSGLFTILDKEPVAEEKVREDWDERLETLVERVEIDGINYLELSPTGQIFHETFKNRFWSGREQILPPPALTKKEPTLTDHNWENAQEQIVNFMKKVTERPYVHHCRTHWWNPRLSTSTYFRLSGEEIEGVYSNGTWTVKIFVKTTATTPGQREACVADLNMWLSEQ